MYRASLWIVCPDCDGFDVGCGHCMGGVVEATRATYDAQTSRALPMNEPDSENAEVTR
jgi:hypothetical protein